MDAMLRGAMGKAIHLAPGGRGPIIAFLR